MIDGAWFITPHAVRRFQERVYRCSYEEALAALVEWSKVAVAEVIADRREGYVYYRGPKYTANGRRHRGRRLRVSFAGGGRPQLVTLL